MLRIEAKTEMKLGAIIQTMRHFMDGTVGNHRKPYVTTLDDGRVRVTGRGNESRGKRFIVYPAVDGIRIILAVAGSDDEELNIAEKIGPALMVGEKSSTVITPMRAGESFGYLGCFN